MVGAAARSIHLPVAAQDSLETLLAMGERAERLGYRRAWMPETWGRDAITTLTALAERTDTVGIGTSILPVYSRSPALIGQTAATLAEASDGRLRLGIGPSGPAVIEGWHGVEYGNPLRRTRETIEVLRAVLSGDRVQYDGEYFTLGGFRLRQGAPETPPPIDVAGMGPTAVELAGRFADGWHAIFLTPDGLRERRADLERGAELADRDPADVRTTVVVLCCALEDGERARRLARRHAAFYIGAMGSFYREALARQGYAETARTVAAAWGSGERERASAAIDDGLLDALGAVGTPDRARERLAAFAALDVVDELAVGFPREADPEEVTATMRALAPS